MPLCIECQLQVPRASGKSLTCAKCSGLVHQACVNVNISKKDFDCLKRGTVNYYCAKCKNSSDTYGPKSTTSSQKQNVSVLSTLGAEPSSQYLDAIRVAVEQGQSNIMAEFQKQIAEMFNVFKIEQTEFNRGLNESILLMKREISNNSKKISAIEVESTDLSKKLKMVKTESDQLKNKVDQLEHIVNVQEQSTLLSTLEVHGLPMRQEEDLRQTFIDIAKALKNPIDINNIDNIYRIRRQGNVEVSQFPPTVVVKLSSQILKDKIINQRKTCKNFTTLDIGWPEKEKSYIYLRDSLTPLNRRIYSAALLLKKSNKIKYLWVAGGKIFGRKADGERRFQLTSLEAVNAIQ